MAQAAKTTKPGVPTHLHAAGLTSRSVTLAWRASARRHASKVHYDVLRDGRHVGLVHHPLFTDVRVAPSSSYRYSVRAVDSSRRRSRLTRTLLVRTPASAPATAPAGPGPAPGPGPGPGQPSGSPPAGVGSGDGLTAAMVDRLFWRAAFGPTDQERGQWVGRPVSELIDFFLGTPNTLAPTATPATNGGRAIDPLASDTDLVLEWLDRMQRSRNPFVERLTLFWHRHWAVARSSVIPAVSLVAYRDRLHRYADFGANPNASFRDLAREMTTQDAAMSIYLNGYENVKRAPNENYAREFQELFCLGVTDAQGAANYSQSDVHQLARAFTGYTLDPAAANPVVTLDAMAQDTGGKTIYGQQGRFDALQAVDLVLSHPAHAPFMVNSLWREFILTPPDAATLADLVATYTAGGRLALEPLMRRILSHPLIFESLEEPNMLKPPIVYAVGVQRQLGAPLTDKWQTAALSNMQQLPYFPPNVAGWEGGPSWINSTTVHARFDLIVRCQSLLPPVADVPGESAQAAFDRAYAAVGSPWLADGTRSLLGTYSSQAGTATPAQRIERQYALRAFMLGGPDAQVM